MIYGDPCLSQKFLRLLWGTHVPCQFIIICVLLMFFSKENEGIARINLPSKIFKFGAICYHVALALGITVQMFHQIRFERNRVKPDRRFSTENIVSEMAIPHIVSLCSAPNLIRQKHHQEFFSLQLRASRHSFVEIFELGVRWWTPIAGDARVHQLLKSVRKPYKPLPPFIGNDKNHGGSSCPAAESVRGVASTLV